MDSLLPGIAGRARGRGGGRRGERYGNEGNAQAKEGREGSVAAEVLMAAAIDLRLVLVLEALLDELLDIARLAA